MPHVVVARALLPAAALAAIALSGAQTRAADDGKLKAYGQHLARECTACHRLDGVDNGIPSIIGWDPDAFVTTLRFYQTGARTNPAMVSVAQSLDEMQMRALAVYFASLPKPPPRPAASAGPGGK
jgi:cytochrome c